MVVVRQPARSSSMVTPLTWASASATSRALNPSQLSVRSTSPNAPPKLSRQRASMAASSAVGTVSTPTSMPSPPLDSRWASGTSERLRLGETVARKSRIGSAGVGKPVGLTCWPSSVTSATS